MSSPQVYGLEIQLYESDSYANHIREAFIDIYELHKDGNASHRTMHRMPVNAIPEFIRALEKIQAGPLGRMAIEAEVTAEVT